jgi:hypothetical protein
MLLSALSKKKDPVKKKDAFRSIKKMLLSEIRSIDSCISMYADKFCFE